MPTHESRADTPGTHNPHPDTVVTAFTQEAGGLEDDEPPRYRGTHEHLCYRVENQYEVDRDAGVLVLTRQGFADGEQVHETTDEWELDDIQSRVRDENKFIVDFARTHHHNDPAAQIHDAAIRPAPDTSIRLSPGHAERLNNLKASRQDTYKDVLERLLWLAEALEGEPLTDREPPADVLNAQNTSEETSQALRDVADAVPDK